MNKLKDYTKYLLDNYVKFNPSMDGNIYLNLTEFYDSNKIKDIIHANCSDKTKISYLGIYRDEIIDFIKEYDTIIDLMSYEDFIND